jgi:FkbM family methyltransferase
MTALSHRTCTLILSVIRPEKFAYYNETRNDRWIAECVFPGKTNGYFLEVGAAGGRETSSCYILETALGWTGICVEPNDDFFKQLVKNRTNSICENVCLAGNSGRVVYIQGDEDTVSPYMGGIKANLEANKDGGRDVIRKGKEVEKDAMSLEELLKKHDAPAVIDYAAFDIEGSELEVLRGFPFGQYTFLALTLECARTIWEPITRLLTSNGYVEVKNPFNRDKPWERYWLHESVSDMQSG